MGLGIWCWINIKGNNGHICRIVCAYQPCGKPTTSPMGILNLCAHKIRYYIVIGGTRCPRMIFREDLVQKIKKWKNMK